MAFLLNDKTAPKALRDAIDLANEAGSLESQAKQNQSGEQYLAEIRQSNQTLESMVKSLSAGWGWKGNDQSKQAFLRALELVRDDVLRLAEMELQGAARLNRSKARAAEAALASAFPEALAE